LETDPLPKILAAIFPPSFFQDINGSPISAPIPSLHAKTTVEKGRARRLTAVNKLFNLILGRVFAAANQELGRVEKVLRLEETVHLSFTSISCA
jgi:hypothetical protein